MSAFWRFGNGFSSVSSVNKILEKPDHTLNDLLDEPDLLQELMSSNSALIEYLRQQDVLQELVDLVVYGSSVHDQESTGETLDVNKDDKNVEESNQESVNSDSQSQSASQSASQPATETSGTTGDTSFEEDDESSGSNMENIVERQLRRADVAAEILSAEIWSLTDAFMEHEELLHELWSVLDLPPPLPNATAKHFMKINEHLLDIKLEELVSFFQRQDNFVARFMKHIDNPPLMDFLLKLISTDKPDKSTGVVALLQRQKLIPSLIAFLGPDVPSALQSAAGDFLKAFITISANSNNDNNTIGPNELTRELVSEPVVRELVRLMLFGGQGLAHGVGIVIEIIRKNNSDYDYIPVLFITIESHPPTPRDPIYLGTLVKVFAENIPAFQRMLTRRRDKKLLTPFGAIEPLGFERFKICELIAELLHCSNMGLLNDENGEAIVKERDLERIRLMKLAAEEEEGGEEDHADDTEDTAVEKETEEEETDSNSITKEPIPGDPLAKDLTKLSLEDVKKASEAAAQEQQVSSDEDVYMEGESSEKTALAGISDRKDATAASLNSASNTEDETESATGSSNVDKGVESAFGPLLHDEAELALRENPVVGDRLKLALADNDVVITILHMFFQFPWNNFLHNVVFDIVQQILNGPMEAGYNRYLAIDLFHRGRITELIVEGQRRCEEYEAETNLRLGYMGHLTLIAEEVVKFTSLFPPETVSDIIVDMVGADEWTNYVNDTLVETREKYNAILGAVREEGEEEEDEEEGEMYDEVASSEEESVGTGSSTVYTSREDDEDEGGDSSNSDENSGINTNHEGNDANEERTSGTETGNTRNVPGGSFSSYLSQQMSNNYPDKFSSSSDEDEEDDDEELLMWKSEAARHAVPNPPGASSTDDDDYVDPNDDGQSYKRSDTYYVPGEYAALGERRRDDSDSDDELEDEEGSYGLQRTTSKGDMSWDEDEQQRLMETAELIRERELSRQ